MVKMKKNVLIIITIIILIVLVISITIFLIKNQEKTSSIEEDTFTQNVNEENLSEDILKIIVETCANNSISDWCYALNDKTVNGCNQIRDQELKQSCIGLNSIVIAAKEKDSSKCEQLDSKNKEICYIILGEDIENQCKKISSDSNLTYEKCLTYAKSLSSNENTNHSADYYFLKAIANNNEDICSLAQFYYGEDNSTNIFNSEVPCRQLINEEYVANCSDFVWSFCKESVRLY